MQVAKKYEVYMYHSLQHNQYTCTFTQYLFIDIFLQSIMIILFLSFQVEVKVHVTPHVMDINNMLLKFLIIEVQNAK